MVLNQRHNGRSGPTKGTINNRSSFVHSHLFHACQTQGMPACDQYSTAKRCISQADSTRAWDEASRSEIEEGLEKMWRLDFVYLRGNIFTMDEPLIIFLAQPSDSCYLIYQWSSCTYRVLICSERGVPLWHYYVNVNVNEMFEYIWFANNRSYSESILFDPVTSLLFKLLIC